MQRLDGQPHSSSSQPYEGTKPCPGPELFPIVYDELRRLAQSLLTGERANHSLQATALVNEAYLKVAGYRGGNTLNRAEFMMVAAQAMRRILVDHARTRNRQKRGGGAPLMSLDEATELYQDRAIDLSTLDEALKEFAGFDPGKARLVELRFFAGLSMEEAARTLDLSVRSAEREWTIARAWLRAKLKEAGL